MNKRIELTIKDQQPRKSNARRILSMGKRCPACNRGRPFSAKSKIAVDYENSFKRQVMNNYRHLMKKHEGLINMTAIIYYKSQRPDLSDEMICDCLERSEVIANDRQIREKHLYFVIDKTNPRTDIYLDFIERLKTPEEIKNQIKEL